MYKVVKAFADLQDNNFNYNVGDVFPRRGLRVSDERISELAGSDNIPGCPLIKKEAVKKTAKTKNADK